MLNAGQSKEKQKPLHIHDGDVKYLGSFSQS